MAGAGAVPRFNRDFFRASDPFTAIGDGSLGGKAAGLLAIRGVLQERLDRARFPGVEVDVPHLVVLATDLFDRFVAQNALAELVASGARDDVVAHAFQRASLPADIVGDLRALVTQVRQPLAVRSSSLLEDARHEPFAGVYGTKMIPNNQHDPDERFRRLIEAVKFVYASTYFDAARSYRAAAGHPETDEKMAVIVQEVVGRRHGHRFYPEISGVARSFNFYAASGRRPEEGVVTLALGLGRTIVEGGAAWHYSPASPALPPPFGSAHDAVGNTQTEFWAVNMGRPPAYDPTAEAEYLVPGSLAEAEADGTLRYTASTYDPHADRLVPGLGRRGPRVLTFAPLLVLNEIPLNAAVQAVMDAAAEAAGETVEIEFAATFDGAGRGRLGIVQVRPMVVSRQDVALADDELASPRAIVRSSAVMGNGVREGIRDIVYVKPGRFEARLTAAVAGQIAERNRELQAAGRPYVLIGFGRWGSSDPWLGIPVSWGQIAAAGAIVEAALPGWHVDPSQASHFFHNVSSFGVPYFTVRDPDAVAWAWLDAQPARHDSDLVRHVALEAPLTVKVDGRRTRGVILRP